MRRLGPRDADLINAAVDLALASERLVDHGRVQIDAPCAGAALGGCELPVWLSVSGVLLSCKAARSAPASLVASPCPETCMYMVAGSERSRWLWSAVISSPFSTSFFITGFTSSWVRTRSPITMASLSPRALKASQEPRAVGDTRYVRVPKKQLLQLRQGLPSARRIRVTWPGVGDCSGPAAGSVPRKRRRPDRRSPCRGGACCRRERRSCAPSR